MKTSKIVTIMLILLISIASANAINTYYTFQQAKDEANWVVDTVIEAEYAADLIIHDDYAENKISITNDIDPGTVTAFLRNFDRGFNGNIGLVWVDKKEISLIYTSEDDMTKKDQIELQEVIENLEMHDFNVMFKKECLECREFIEPGITGKVILTEVENCKTTEGAYYLYAQEENRKALLQCYENEDNVIFNIRSYIVNGKKIFIEKNRAINAFDLCGCKEGFERLECCNLAMERYYHINELDMFCTDQEQKIEDFYQDIAYYSAKKIPDLCSTFIQSENINLKRTDIFKELEGYEELNKLLDREEIAKMHKEQSPEDEPTGFFYKLKKFLGLL